MNRIPSFLTGKEGSRVGNVALEELLIEARPLLLRTPTFCGGGMIGGARCINGDHHRLALT